MMSLPLLLISVLSAAEPVAEIDLIPTPVDDAAEGEAVVSVESASRRITGSTAAERMAAYRTWLVGSRPTDPRFPKAAMAAYAAKLHAGHEVDATLDAIRQMMAATAKGRIDPFNRHAVMHGLLICPGRYPADIDALFKAEVSRQDYTRGIGVSLNYELMSDAAAYVAAERWPDLVDRGGNDAAKIRALTRKRLLAAYAITLRRNAQEYEAPLYYGTDIMPTRMLAEFAQDPEVKRVATVALAGMLVHLGAHWHQGYFITASARAKYWGSNNLSPDAPGATTAMAFLLFGGQRPSDLSRIPQAYWLAHPGSALPLDWLTAWHAALPAERSVTGSVLREDKGIRVHKQSWYTDGYGLASQRTDGSGPTSYLYKECRSVLLRWVSDQPASSFLVYQENRLRTKQAQPNRFCYGENPYAQFLQDRGTVVAVYDVPEDYGFSDLHVPFTTRGAIRQRVERNGWVFVHGGSVLFGFRSLTPGTWEKPDKKEGLDLLRVTGRQGGWVLETASPTNFAGGDDATVLERFAEAVVRRTTVTDGLAKRPVSVGFRSLAGRQLDLTWHPPQEPYGGQCRIDGTVVPYDAYPLIATDGLRQEPEKTMVIRLPGGGSRTLDFTAWTMTSSGTRP